ncbi:MAG: 3-hydroxybutyryl-CoA dehydrogenase; 3-hydroxyacyl-CoA dehydrogenase [uncultured Truepera sp.]|uniref:3-hydroxybutyryl-CoA dehydrogenase 3-hydroxyacyl-CoA dehydrogenase n=1 Tax=uncultured Truepera sp. TaxID=543023 RepID=A0A6J4VY00_9DEIN|nr:MAG: 3-hydroxybutyryl-CoA dehydrogenase; 3-hydroxyacyl-CoA dehydrogenase [uncultured Truepera sp.]
MSETRPPKVAVIGAGTMGSGIAQACAVRGLNVTLFDTQAEALQRGLKGMDASLARIVRKGGLTEAAKRAALGRVKATADLSGIGDADVVIEAVFEDLTVKREVWGRVAEVAEEGALLASNTSSLPITEIAAGVGRPERFCGLHFFNPVPVLPLVEVVRAQRTSEETVERAKTFVERIGKTPILCDDKPGFIVNRLLIPYLSDAVFALSEGVGSAEDIDTAMKLGANMPLGPLALIDLVGLDVALAAAESLHREFQDPKFRVPPLLRQLVRAGKLGRKSGEGFYRYEETA